MATETLPAKRLENALTKLQDAQSALKMAMKIEAVEHHYWEPWIPPRTGSKRYQRRRAQRWPK